jgi:hypothetical protein
MPERGEDGTGVRTDGHWSDHAACRAADPEELFADFSVRPLRHLIVRQ